MHLELIERLKEKYPNVDIDKVLAIWKTGTDEIKLQFPEGPAGREIRFSLDSDLNGNLIVKIIDTYVKSFQ